MGSLDAPGGTVMMARWAADDGVPPAIIGRMAVTPYYGKGWLDKADLRSMGAIIVDPKTQQPEPP